MTISFHSATPDRWANLLWAISAPDIAPEFSLPWLPRERRHDLYQFFASHETATRLRSGLELNLQKLTSRRLGTYFEGLWAFAFTHHPDYELLAHNLPIRSEGMTLGELDFVVRYLPDGALEHWEVAVKFYLQVGDFWIGPGLKDRLDIKLARMRDHQLPVARTPAGGVALQKNGILLDRQWALMPGRLFASASQQIGDFWWVDADEFERQFSRFDGHWLQLPKQTWLAPLTINNHDPDGFLPATTGQLAPLTSWTSRSPICVAGFQGSAEVSRGFIVPDNWLVQARQQILSA